MAWRIELDDAAKKDLAKLDKPVAKRITAFIRERLALLDDPRSIGDALKGSRLGNLKLRKTTSFRQGLPEPSCHGGQTRFTSLCSGYRQSLPV